MVGKPVARVVALSLLSLGLLAAAWAQPPVALADDTAVGTTGGSIYPVESADIRLVAETVQATCFGSFAEYRVDFSFFNEGERQKVKLGFPFTDTIDVWDTDGSPQPIGFQAWRDGEPLAVTAVPARKKGEKTVAGYFVHEASFPPGATRITVSYIGYPTYTAREHRRDPSGEDEFSMAGWHRYWLHTGSTWKGDIGEAVVRYQLADSFTGIDIELGAADLGEDVPATAPAGWRTPFPRTYQWEFSDFEPRPTSMTDWWKPHSDYDVTLGFGSTGDFLPTTPVRWKWSSEATGREYLPWIEGVPGLGRGEWIEARFKRAVRLRELRILPGNLAYMTAFYRYARPKSLKAVFSDGTSVRLRLEDAPTLQRFPVDVETRSVRLVIDSAYRGTDYPATCIALVEFGRERAPGYAAFDRLIADPSATGDLPAWAGPGAPAPELRGKTFDWQEERDADVCAGGDLIGIDSYAAFPADKAPFKKPASVKAVLRRNPAVHLPEEALVGEPDEVNALSYWAYEIQYPSGVDLLVNTRLSGVPSRSVRAERRSGNGPLFKDGRRRQFDIVTVGDTAVGVAEPGRAEFLETGRTQDVPGQVFWSEKDDDVSYHLYARSEDVTVDDLLAVATSLIGTEAAVEPVEPSPVESPSPTPSPVTASPSAAGGGVSPWQWWLAGGIAAVLVALVVLAVLRRRRAGAGVPPETSP